MGKHKTGKALHIKVNCYDKDALEDFYTERYDEACKMFDDLVEKGYSEAEAFALTMYFIEPELNGL